MQKLKIFPSPPFLYVIFDGRPGILEKLKGIIHAGAEIVQLRDKELSAREIVQLGLKAKKIIKEKAFFFVNDRFDIALAVGADGVHLGQDDLPVELVRNIGGEKLFIGLSTHNAKEVRASNTNRIDYISFGPVFKTKTKLDALPPRGVGMLKEAVSCAGHKVVAIGGIDRDNLEEVLKTGASGAALSSGILEARDSYKAACCIRKILRGYDSYRKDK